MDNDIEASLPAPVLTSAPRCRFGLYALPDDGTVEIIKWLALLAMVISHSGALLFQDPVFSLSYQVGRLAFPTFAFVLGYKLSRKAVIRGEPDLQTPKRLLLWALLSSGPFYMAIGRLWPPNIFFTLALGATLCWLSLASLHLPYRLAAHLGILAASFACDYLAPGVYLIPSVFSLYLHRRVQPGLAVALCLAGLTFLNFSAWTLLAFPLALLTHVIRLPFPRVGWFFYAFYPAHLVLLATLELYR